MKIDRRNALKGTAILSAAATIPASAARAATDKPLIVYDSRLAEARAFVDGRSGYAALDIAGEEATLWQELRSAEAAPHRIEGLTRWSDYVQLREVYEERGLRVTAEHRVSAPLSKSRELFRWSMAERQA